MPGLRPLAGGCVIAAPGPSLDLAPLWLTDGRLPTIAVQDAYRRLPNADILYGCDSKWWKARNWVSDFQGERWCVHAAEQHDFSSQVTIEEADQHGLKMVDGYKGNRFMEKGGICYGDNSGFQAINLAMFLGADLIYLIGFDMRLGKRAHFFGNHPPELGQGDYQHFLPNFKMACAHLPDGVVILNCTPGSALKPFLGYYDPYELRCLERLPALEPAPALQAAR